MDLAERSVCVILAQCRYNATTRPVIAVLSELFEKFVLRILTRASHASRLSTSCERVRIQVHDPSLSEDKLSSPPQEDGLSISVESLVEITKHMVGPVEEILDYVHSLGRALKQQNINNQELGAGEHIFGGGGGVKSIDFFSERALIPQFMKLVQDTRNEITLYQSESVFGRDENDSVEESRSELGPDNGLDSFSQKETLASHNCGERNIKNDVSGSAPDDHNV